MKLTQDSADGHNFIKSYGRGQITVNETVVTGSVIVTPDSLDADWEPLNVSDLREAHFQGLMELDPEVVVFGSGARLEFPSPTLTLRLTQAHIGVEVMDTAAACRTYNILMSEDRRVVAALLPIQS